MRIAVTPHFFFFFGGLRFAMSDLESPSFDPQSWLDKDSMDAANATPQKPERAPVRVPRMAMALAGSATLLSIGAGAAWMSRDTVAPPEATGPAVAVADPPAETATSRRIVTLANAAELQDALVANGIDARTAGRAADAALAVLPRLAAEVRVSLALAGEGKAARLVRLDISFPDSSGAIVRADAGGGFLARAVPPSLDSRIVAVRGEMNDTDFYSSAVSAGVTDSLISTFAEAFVYDFNFQTEIRAGDVFEAAFEQQVNAQGQAVGPPRLLYASMTTPDKAKAVYRYKPAGGDEGWYDGNGRSVKRSFMRTPVDGARITSRFGMRFHPVLHYTRLHGGTDFAAPIGTPIYATAAGVVQIANPSSCAGNMVIVRHDNGWETAYFHMHRYAPDITVGKRVAQGKELGVVGTTGVCTTGPHLHYEVHIDGEKVDPQSIPTEAGEALTGEALKAFVKERDRIDVARVQSAK